MTIANSTFAVLLPAAGTGTRFASGGGVGAGWGDKLLVDIGGRSVLQRSVALFAQRTDVAIIGIITARERFAAYEEHLVSAHIIERERLVFIAGGRERWESVLFGLRGLASRQGVPRFVAVHDAARPLTAPAVIDEAFRMTLERGAALPCVAEPATLKRRAASGVVQETVDRRNLHQAQTPQCFELGKLLAGYEHLLTRGLVGDLTDDAQVYERMGWPVTITMGDSTNIKITTGSDVHFAKAVMAAREAQ